MQSIPIFQKRTCLLTQKKQSNPEVKNKFV